MRKDFAKWVSDGEGMRTWVPSELMILLFRGVSISIKSGFMCAFSICVYSVVSLSLNYRGN